MSIVDVKLEKPYIMNKQEIRQKINGIIKIQRIKNNVKQKNKVTKSVVLVINGLKYDFTKSK